MPSFSWSGDAAELQLPSSRLCKCLVNIGEAKSPMTINRLVACCVAKLGFFLIRVNFFPLKSQIAFEYGDEQFHSLPHGLASECLSG